MFSLGATLDAAQEQNAKLTRDYNVKPVPFNNVHVEDDFWTPRLEASRKVTIPYCFDKCEEISIAHCGARDAVWFQFHFMRPFFVIEYEAVSSHCTQHELTSRDLHVAW